MTFRLPLNGQYCGQSISQTSVRQIGRRVSHLEKRHDLIGTAEQQHSHHPRKVSRRCAIQGGCLQKFITIAPSSPNLAYAQCRHTDRLTGCLLGERSVDCIEWQELSEFDGLMANRLTDWSIKLTGILTNKQPDTGSVLHTYCETRVRLDRRASAAAIERRASTMALLLRISDR